MAPAVSEPPAPSAAVVGAGAVGLLYAAAFGDAAVRTGVKPPVLVSRRREVVDAVTARGIVVEGGVGGAAGSVLAVSPEELAHDHRRDVVVVVARSFESDYAVEVAERLVSHGGIVFVLQNGLAGWDAARRLQCANVSGATYVGAWTAAPNRVVCTRLAPTAVPTHAPGMSVVQRDRLSSLMSSTSLPFRVAGTEGEIVWRKTLFTTVNWVAAVTGLPSYLVRATDAWRAALRPLLREAKAVADAESVRVHVDDLLDEIEALPSPSGSKGSAFSALERHQPLEVIDICNSILRRADAALVATPMTRLIRDLAQIQERGFSSLPRMMVAGPSQRA